jgi:hypothetical protein
MKQMYYDKNQVLSEKLKTKGFIMYLLRRKPFPLKKGDSGKLIIKTTALQFIQLLLTWFSMVMCYVVHL